MERLVFKKWVEYLVMFMFVVGWFIVAAFEWETFTPYIIGLLLMIGNGILLTLFGRDDERKTN